MLREVPDSEATLDRFYKTVEVKAFGALLKDHLVIAARLVEAAGTGDSQAAAEAERRWYANADEIVRPTHRMNPFWTPRVWTPMWHDHLALTKDEAVQVLTGQYVKSIHTFDEIEKLA